MANVALYATLAGSALPARGAYTVLHSHQPRWAYPSGGLVTDGSGWLYGATMYGGDNNQGAVYRVREDGTGFETLHSFEDGGGGPISTLTLGQAGLLFGTRSPRSPSGLFTGGTVFELKTDGTGFRVLHEFVGGPDDGADPEAALVLDRAGNLYGTTVFGGAADLGTVFKLRMDGSKFAVLHSFSQDGDGFSPRAALVLDRAQNLYGTTSGYNYGTDATPGTVFTIKTNGNGFRVLHAFQNGPLDGAYPVAPLVLGAGDVLYGTTSEGGSAYQGTVFRLRTDGGEYAVLHTFTDSSSGISPAAGLILGGSGSLFGTLSSGHVYKLAIDGTGFALLHEFGSERNDGYFPESELLLDGGRLYGATSSGGPARIGIVYSLRTDGTSYAHVHDFLQGDGVNPLGGIIGDRDGNLYGTTYDGGAFGWGAVYAMRSDGSGYRLLHSFDDVSGSSPHGTLVLDDQGNLYGTTNAGGSAGGGTVFTLKTDGSGFRLLHDFRTVPLDGANPIAGLVADGRGYLYGSTLHGGSLDAGAIFKVSTDGDPYVILHSCGEVMNDGGVPGASLAIGGDGFLYGTTSFSFVVFRLQLDGGGYEVIHTFPLGYAANGAGVVLDGSGSLYGTTFLGPYPWENGVVFKMSVDGSRYQVLHYFSGPYDSDASNPIASLIIDASGTLYGTTIGGGMFGSGAVFKLRTDGTGYALLHSFEGQGSPWAPVYLDDRGFLYGSTYGGLIGESGLEFRLSANPGDANGDGAVNISDVFYLINALYSSGPEAFAGGDANGDGATDVADVFYLLNYLYAGGPAPHN